MYFRTLAAIRSHDFAHIGTRLGAHPGARIWARLGPLVARIVLILGFANLIAISARIAFPLPFSPVPVTGQTLAVLLAGLCLGSREGALAPLACIGEGLLGLPVFAGGRAGLAVLLGPTGGYLAGFVAAAFVVGWLAERNWSQRSVTLFAALALGTLTIYTFGAIWLAGFIPTGPGSVLAAGVLPFIPGDIAKALLAAATVPSARRLLAQMRRQ